MKQGKVKDSCSSIQVNVGLWRGWTQSKFISPIPIGFTLNLLHSSDIKEMHFLG